MSSEDDRARRPGRAGARTQKRNPAEEFAYKVELWNEGRQAVEQVLAVATSAAIAHAAFYAAAREFGERYVTLKLKGAIINRWNGPSH
jgi:hypothetical protein